MLIRPGGGNSGIKEYLETGQKAGRELSRDELDQRITLDGNLALTDSIIQSIESDGERYLHFTLSFKEDHISTEVMREIVQEFKRFAGSAFRSDEWNMYAEAHIPKVASYTNTRTGELIERYPHIHVVIPEKNLLTGKKANPFGMTENQTKFIDAFQEHINNRFGLASPKDSRRLKFTNESEMITRYKGDLFDGQNQHFREMVLGQVLDRKIDSWPEFKKMLSEFGATHEAKGKGGNYISVKPGADFPMEIAGKSGSVRLKDYVFSPEFIALPDAEKRARLSAEIKREYQEASAARRDPESIAATLKEWHDIRAKEVKYINSGNRNFYAEYKAASHDEQRAILADREERFYNRFGGENHGQQRPDQQQPNRTAEHGLANTQTVGSTPPPAARNRMRNLSECDVVRIASGNEVLLSSDVSSELEHKGAQPDNALRRAFHESGASVKDSVTGHLQRDNAEAKAVAASASSNEWTTIRLNLSAERLLGHLSKTHGVILEKYEVTKGKDGGDRIKCGSRQLTPADFLTKQMGLPWNEAAPILREVYAAQLGQEPVQTSQRPEKGLWQSFQGWKADTFKAEKDGAFAQQRESETTRKNAIRDTFAKDKARIEAEAAKTRNFTERRAALSVCRMTKALADKSLSDTIKGERADLKARYQLKHGDLYREFLRREAGRGNEKALTELRRQQAKAPLVAPLQKGEGAASGQQQNRDPISHDRLRLTYTVNRQGDVSYLQAGREIIRDQVKRVTMLNHDGDTIETGLRLAMQKFGSRLELTGTDEFKRQAVEISIERGLRIDFSNPGLNEYRQQLEESRKQDMVREFSKATRPAEVEKKAPPEPKKPAPDTTPERAGKSDFRQWLDGAKTEIETKKEAERTKEQQQQEASKSQKHEPGHEPGF